MIDPLAHMSVLQCYNVTTLTLEGNISRSGIKCRGISENAVAKKCRIKGCVGEEIGKIKSSMKEQF